MPYPLVAWPPQDIIARIQRLNDHQFYYESVIVSCQLVERLLKRVVRNELAAKGLKLDKPEGTTRLVLVEAASLNEIDKSLSLYCQSISSLGRAPWKLAVKPRIKLTLPQAIATLMDSKAWNTLMSPKLIPASELHDSVLSAQSYLGHANVPVRFGLNHLRHKLVHAANAVDKELVALHACFGKELVGGLIDPVNGLTSLGLYSPLKRCRIHICK